MDREENEMLGAPVSDLESEGESCNSMANTGILCQSRLLGRCEPGATANTGDALEKDSD